MKFLVPNYSCPQIPVLSDPCPQLNFLNPPPRTKLQGTPLIRTVVFRLSSDSAGYVPTLRRALTALMKSEYL